MDQTDIFGMEVIRYIIESYAYGCYEFNLNSHISEISLLKESNSLIIAKLNYLFPFVMLFDLFINYIV